MMALIRCMFCMGTGRVHDNGPRCKTCGGRGKVFAGVKR